MVCCETPQGMHEWLSGQILYNVQMKGTNGCAGEQCSPGFLCSVSSSLQVEGLKKINTKNRKGRWKWSQPLRWQIGHQGTMWGLAKLSAYCTIFDYTLCKVSPTSYPKLAATFWQGSFSSTTNNLSVYFSNNQLGYGMACWQKYGVDLFISKGCMSELSSYSHHTFLNKWCQITKAIFPKGPSRTSLLETWFLAFFWIRQETHAVGSNSEQSLPAREGTWLESILVLEIGSDRFVFLHSSSWGHLPWGRLVFLWAILPWVSSGKRDLSSIGHWVPQLEVLYWDPLLG